MSEDESKAKDEFVIHVDRQQFRVPGPTITGAAIRKLPTPAIGDDFDIYEEQSIGFVRGAKDDQSYRSGFFDSLKRRLGDAKTKNTALDLCSKLFAVDGPITPQESEALKTYRRVLF